MPRCIIYNFRGEDITLLCILADGLIFNDGNGRCLYKDDCELYCNGCEYFTNYLESNE